jgi:hypothetical protein
LTLRGSRLVRGDDRMIPAAKMRSPRRDPLRAFPVDLFAEQATQRTSPGLWQRAMPAIFRSDLLSWPPGHASRPRNRASGDDHLEDQAALPVRPRNKKEAPAQRRYAIRLRAPGLRRRRPPPAPPFRNLVGRDRACCWGFCLQPRPFDRVALAGAVGGRVGACADLSSSRVTRLMRAREQRVASSLIGKANR